MAQMRIAGAPDGVIRVARARRGATEEIRCPSCSRLLVLRTGPAITPHFAHRPRQSCRQRPGRPPLSPLRLEQLSLFELEPSAPPTPDDPLVRLEAGLVYPPSEPTRGFSEAERAPTRGPTPGRRRRRRAWLPRLIRWLKTESLSWHELRMPGDNRWR